MMVAWGCAVWGSGWYYPPYCGLRRRLSRTTTRATRPTATAPRTTRGPARYGRGAVGVRSVRRRRRRRALQPAHRHLLARRRRLGPGRRARRGEAYNPRTGAYGQTRQGSNVYGSWGTTSVQRGDQWAQTARVTNNARPATTTRVTQGSGGGAAVTQRAAAARTRGVVRTGSGDVYAGRDGNVYRNEGGSWQKYDNGSWGSVDRPTPQAGTTQARDRSTTGSGATAGAGTPPRGTSSTATRGRASEGTQRTRDYSSYRGSGSSRSSRAELVPLERRRRRRRRARRRRPAALVRNDSRTRHASGRRAATRGGARRSR